MRNELQPRRIDPRYTVIYGSDERYPEEDIVGDPVARVEQPDGSIEGSVSAFLDKVYLKDYNKIVRERYPGKEYLTHVSDVIDQVFSPLKDPYAKYHDMVGVINFTGELPRAIADEEGMNPDYWSDFTGLQEDTKRYLTSKNPLVRDFCASRLGFPRTPDIDITFRDISVNQVSEWFKEIYNIKGDRIKNDGVREQYELFRDESFIVDIDSGPLPTKTDIILMFINIRDAQTGDVIFHLDVGEFPPNAQATVADKRVIHASEIHDKCQAVMEWREGHLYYTMTKEAKEVLGQPDRIPTEGKDAGAIAEMLTRTTRIASGHKRKNATNLEFFLPWVDSETAFKVGEAFRAAAIRHKDIDLAILFFIIKEQILTFRRDPYLMVHAYRDSFIGEINPDSIIAQMTPYQWDEILRSNSFAITKRGEDLIPKPLRDLAYLNQQRELYRTGIDENGQRYRDGLKRFIHAMVEIGVLPGDAKNDLWGAFFDLWIKKKASVTEIVAGTDIVLPASSASVARIKKNGKSVVMYYEDGTPMTTNDTEDIAISVADNIPPRADGIDSITAVLRELENCGDPDLEQSVKTYFKLYRKQGLSPDEMIERARVKDKVYSLGRLLLIIQQNPSALTPRQLKQEYIKVRGRFHKGRFQDQLLRLKKLGKVSLYQRQRITMVRHRVVPVERYYPVPQEVGLHKVSDIVQRNDLMEIVYQFIISKQEAESQFKDLSNKLFLDTGFALDDLGISLEALESFTPVDYRRLTNTNMLNKNLTEQVRNLQYILRLAYALRYLEGQSIPEAYSITFQSHDGEEILQQVKEKLIQVGTMVI